MTIRIANQIDWMTDMSLLQLNRMMHACSPDIIMEDWLRLYPIKFPSFFILMIPKAFPKLYSIPDVIPAFHITLI